MTSSRMDYGNMANRILVLAYVIFYLLTSGTGCGPGPGPGPSPDQGIVIQAPAFNDDQDILALAMAQQTGGVSPSPAPGPTPNGPQVGDTCEDCRGTGVVGDGTIERPCKPCKGDGKLDLGDPGLSSTSQVTPVTVVPHTNYHQFHAGGPAVQAEKSPSQEKADEHSIVTSEALEKVKDDVLKGHSDQEQAIDELKQRLDSEIGELLKQHEEDIAELAGRVNQLEATLKAAEQREAEAVKQLQKINEEFKQLSAKPSAKLTKPVAAAEYHYRILWKGVPHIWEQDQLAFIAEDGHRISFTEMGDISKQASVQVCQNTPQGRLCTWVPVERKVGAPPKRPAIIQHPAEPAGSSQQPVGNSSQKSNASPIAPTADGAKIVPDSEVRQPPIRDGVNIPAPVPADLSASVTWLGRSHYASIDAYLHASEAKLLRNRNRHWTYLQGSRQAQQSESPAGVADSRVRSVSLPIAAN